MSLQIIQKYYRDVDDIIQYGGSNSEVVISQKFGDLINAYCEKRTQKLKLIPQLEFKTKEGKLIRPDGTIKNALRKEYGFWESKANVNLDEEIRKKFNAEYPKNNILFEDSKIAILYQDGEMVKRAKIREENELDKILTMFVNFEHPEVKQFNQAVEQFKKDIPNVVESLREMIVNQEISNTNFLQARNSFYTLCKQSINPSITLENINEMLIQHILTEEIFMSVFSDNQFIKENNIAGELYKVEESFFTGSTKRQTLDSIRNYYDVIKNTAASNTDHHEKQTFLKVIYENFYKAYNPKGADRLGIVYTPNEIVKFQIESTDYLLHKHFGKGLANKDVEILDPATGTGTYICDLIEYIPKQYLEYKYTHEIHANEVAILPYYIANLNIEYTFRQKMGYYHEFKNICFVDTLDSAGGLIYNGKQHMLGFSVENARRIVSQNERKISVIMGNPPYNAKQENFNQQNANRTYDEIDKRIKNTYVKHGTAQNQIVLYDMYVRFFRWACDRIDNNGIIAYITNNSFVNSMSFDGFRKEVVTLFNEIYIIDLKGNARTAGERRRQEKGNVFDDKIRVGVAIYFLVKNDKLKDLPCKIFYNCVNDYLTSEKKISYLTDNNIGEINFTQVFPDEKSNWIQLTDNNFDDLIPLYHKQDQCIFSLCFNGIQSNRDEWVYDINIQILNKKIKYFIENYNNSIINGKMDLSIRWTYSLEEYFNRKEKLLFSKDFIKIENYRPFYKTYHYCSKPLNHRLTQNHTDVWGKSLSNENITINFTGISSREFSVFAVNTLLNVQFQFNAVNVSLYRYDKSGNRIENITDWGLQQFQNQYENLAGFENPQGLKISKEDIFHYVYAVLHNPAYRKKYELNLKRDFPRIPFYADFWQWVAWGKQLIDLHINYETVEPFPLKVINLPDFKNLADFVPKAKLKANKADGEIILDELTALQGIPPEAWEYKLGIRSAMEWILDQYRESVPTDATIREKFNTYKFADYKDHVIDLLQRVCTVSVRTVQIMNEMEKMGE